MQEVKFHRIETIQKVYPTIPLRKGCEDGFVTYRGRYYY